MRASGLAPRWRRRPRTASGPGRHDDHARFGGAQEVVQSGAEPFIFASRLNLSYGSRYGKDPRRLDEARRRRCFLARSISCPKSHATHGAQVSLVLTSGTKAPTGCGPGISAVPDGSGDPGRGTPGGQRGNDMVYTRHSPRSTSVPSARRATHRRRVMGLSGRASSTSASAVTVSPMKTGAG